ncbi:MAG: hypothetical protein V4649_01520 [Bacteroidota bacterium]
MKGANPLVKFIFFGNYFYGICTVALTIEATLQQRYPLNDLGYFVAIFASTVLYYTKAYITEQTADNSNVRGVWYARNHVMIKSTQLFFTAIVLVWAALFIKNQGGALLRMSISGWLLFLIFPMVAGAYYGINHPVLARYNLRNIGWLKPFVIGFTWAGLATMYPVLYYSVTHGAHLPVTLLGCLLFLKNFMYITMLSILFDIKDYKADHNRQLKTFVVKAGLRKTIFMIIIPLTVVGLGCFLAYGLMHRFSTMKIILNTIPFLLLIATAYSMQRRKSLFFYLVLIDGLMLLKACFGIVAMRYF